MTRRLRIERVPGEYVVHRLPAGSDLPAGLPRDGFVSVTRTPDEVSVVAPRALEMEAPRSQPGWAAFRVEGPLDFAWTGIVASLATALAEAGIPIFVLSTFDTDWLLVPSDRAEDAAAAWRDAGHEVP